MIISVSRRTDIPSYFTDWFINRLKEGYVLVRNPMNFHQISKIKLTPEMVDGIVFWTKNPEPMIARLTDLTDYMYYFQFTITPYGRDIEPNLPEKSTVILDIFKRISSYIGKERVIWRYDPILINSKYSFDYHIHAFERIANQLNDYTEKVTISFIDENYRGVKSNIQNLNLNTMTIDTILRISKELSCIAHNYHLSIDTCAEEIELKQFGIEHARCIDDRLLEKLLGYNLNIEKDKSQRLVCGCVSSIDVGMYNTCKNGCRYCYANYNSKLVETNTSKHDHLSPLLSGEVSSDDKIIDRNVRSIRDTQMKISNK